MVRISVNLAKDLRFLRKDVKIPAKTIIVPCPSENKNNISAEYAMLADKEAVAMIPARMGVEQGVVARAKTAPSSIGYVYVLCFVFCGKLFTSTGKFMSITPTRFSPKMKISEAKNSTQ